MCNVLDGLFVDLIAFAMHDPTPRGNQRLGDLCKAHEMCTRRVTAVLQALSPIQWIPREILAEIFVHCLPEDHRFSRNFAPLSVSQVCRVWRALALSNRSLWKKLSFWSPPTSKRDHLCYPTRLVNKWLSHRGFLPLQLYFDCGMSYAHMKTFVELVLLEHYPRCQHLELSVTWSSVRGLVNFINLPAGSLIKLECLVLVGLDEVVLSSEEGEEDEEDESEDIIVPITVFQDSPMLRKLATNSLDFAFHVGNDEIQFNVRILPWIQLTHLLITEFVDIDIFVHTLAECLAIQFLRVSLNLRRNDEEQSHVSHTNLPARVVLPDLTAIYISVNGGLSFPFSMDIFQFPALNALHFRRHHNSLALADLFSWTESAHFCAELGRLQHLSLTGHIGSTEQVISLLRCTSTITTLTLDIYVDYAMLIPVLFPENSVSPLPHLAKLELHLERRELCYPRGTPVDISEIHRSGVKLRRMRDISQESLQPCIFRLREMIESTQSCLLRSLSMFYLRGPPCEKSLHELRKQFRSSTLETRFEKKNASLRTGLDRDLMENHSGSTSYTLG